MAIWLASVFIKETSTGSDNIPFDTKGFVLMATALSALLVAFELIGKSIAPTWSIALLAGVGFVSLWQYLKHSQSLDEPILDFRIFRFQTFRTNVLGGIPLRIGIGASPFLLPLMLQVGFGLSPIESGILTVATAVGALCTRAVMTLAIKALGFRTLLICATLITCVLYVSYSFFTPSTNHILIFITLMAGGLFNSMCMVTLGTLGFSEITKEKMGNATTLATMVQQLTVSFGVALGGTLLTAVSFWNGGAGEILNANYFAPVFVTVGVLASLSLVSFLKLHHDEGSAMR